MIQKPMAEAAKNDTMGSKPPSSQSDDPETKSEQPVFVGLPQNPYHEAVFVFVVCTAQLMTQAGLSLSIAPLQDISASFNTTPKDLSWASAADS